MSQPRGPSIERAFPGKPGHACGLKRRDDLLRRVGARRSGICAGFSTSWPYRLIIAAGPLLALACPSLAQPFSIAQQYVSTSEGLLGPGPIASQSVLSRQPSAAALVASTRPEQGNHLARSIARAASESIVELGTATAKQAVLDCLKGEYPGGGMGSLSLPFGRAAVQTDHCRQR